MKEKAFTLINKGMSRDLSVSKTGQASAYENYNIRIEARDNDTMLSVTNEKGTKLITDVSIDGTLVGWNVLNEYIILFSHEGQILNKVVLAYDGNHYWHAQAQHPVDVEIEIEWDTTIDDPGSRAGLVYFTISEGETVSGSVEALTQSYPTYQNCTVTPEISSEYHYYIEDDLPESDIPKDRIYRIYCGQGITPEFTCTKIYQGNLGLSPEHPIESVVYSESDSIKKIYWVDGVHQLRFMNFMKDYTSAGAGTADTEYAGFDVNGGSNDFVAGSISKDNSGATRLNGTVQYYLTFYNQYGNESGVAWTSGLVYLSPMDKGGAPDGYNNNRITLAILVDPTGFVVPFERYRVYSIFRSSLNGEPVGHIVAEGILPETGAAGVYIETIDTGANQSTIDPTEILYKGSQDVVPGTMAYKDQTLFLGNLRKDTTQDAALLSAINSTMFSDSEGTQTEFVDGVTWQADSIIFDTGIRPPEVIPLTDNDALYAYDYQLNKPSTEITTFKGGEKYRFALVFFTPGGVASPAFWIGDKVNDVYPRFGTYLTRQGRVKKGLFRVTAQCSIPESVVLAAKASGYSSVQLMVAKATYSDRSIQAQGLLNPTMFNVWERFSNRTYAVPSWITRPRESTLQLTGRHFEVVNNADTPVGEIASNYWTGSFPVNPFYRLTGINTSNPQFTEEFDGYEERDFVIVTVGVAALRRAFIHVYAGQVTIITATLYSETGYNDLMTLEFSSITWDYDDTYTDDNDPPRFKLKRHYSGVLSTGTAINKDSRRKLRNKVNSYIIDTLNSEEYVVNQETFDIFTSVAYAHRYTGDDNKVNEYFWNTQFPGEDDYLGWRQYSGGVGMTPDGLLDEPDADATRWKGGTKTEYSRDYTASYYKQHLMFVDENTITLDSPEITYGAVNVDKAEGLKLRIIGLAWQKSHISDYLVDASHAKLPGENPVARDFSSVESSPYKTGSHPVLKAWPLWSEYGLHLKDVVHPEDEKDYTSSDYEWASSVSVYWLHMWERQGIISGYNDPEGNRYSELRSKTFANLSYFHRTDYLYDSKLEYDLDSIRMIVGGDESGKILTVGGEDKMYSGTVDTALSMPGTHKYPILCSSPAEVNIEDPSAGNYLYSNDMVQIGYRSGAHAVMTLHTYTDYDEYEGYRYNQTLLPYLSIGSYDYDTYANNGASSSMTGSLIPWEKNYDVDHYINYWGHKDAFVGDSRTAEAMNNEQWPYLFVGELFYDYDSEPTSDTRYGGITLSAVSNNTFIPAGEKVSLSENLDSDTSTLKIKGVQGDTFIQRFDSLRTRPLDNAVNNVYDIASVYLESHINLDGRYDNQRGNKYIASTDETTFGQINPAYSQEDNIRQYREIQDTSADSGNYDAGLTWTTNKSDLADIDAWTHITLSSYLALDGDKGSLSAIRRFNNGLFAFQDRAISEILFNTRTQLSTEDGVPVEIANSGKVDGKRYITTNYGCRNKWSIVEGKSALYFVDSLNKAFCAFNGGAIDNLSTRLGFDAWFKRNIDPSVWNATESNTAEISFYDKKRSDVYVLTQDDQLPCLVYNEVLGVFTSFYGYSGVPMMCSVLDRFVSFKNTNLWLQNEGDYGMFFGSPYNSYMQFRVTPDPYLDKIWTNIEYRTDFYSKDDLTEEPSSGAYIPNETFDAIRIWNEYQNTNDFVPSSCGKKFRIWRAQIPRAVKTATNKYGLDRIRNPWINIRFTKNRTADLMQVHDITIKYFE